MVFEQILVLYQCAFFWGKVIGRYERVRKPSRWTVNINQRCHPRATTTSAMTDPLASDTVRVRLRDYANVVQDVEDNFRSDLAVHLYLTSLMRRVDPLIPPSYYFTWPLPKDNIPVTNTAADYVDLRQQAPPEITTRYSVDDEEPVEMAPHVRRYKLVRRECDVVQNLDIELGALIERKVIDKLHDESPLDGVMMNPGTRLIINKVKRQLHRVLQHLKWNDPPQGTFQDWQSVLLAALMAARPLGESINIPLFKQLCSRYNKLYNDIRFPYKYQSEVKYDDDEDDEEDENETNTRNSDENGSTGFDVVEYLKRLRDEVDKTFYKLRYNKIIESYDDCRGRRLRSNRRNMKTIMKTLEAFEHNRRLPPSRMSPVSGSDAMTVHGLKLKTLNKIPDIAAMDYAYKYDPPPPQPPKLGTGSRGPRNKKPVQENQTDTKPDVPESVETPHGASMSGQTPSTNGNANALEHLEFVWDPALSTNN